MQKLKNVQVLTISAFLVAIATVLGFFKIPVSEIIEIRFQYLPIAASGFLFGPAIGGIVGMLADILGYIVKPTGAFFPGFTISSIASGLIYGWVLYKKEVTIPRILIAQAIESVVCSLLINSINLSILYGSAFTVILSAKLIKALVMFPIKSVMLYLMLKTIPAMLPSHVRESFLN